MISNRTEKYIDIDPHAAEAYLKVPSGEIIVTGLGGGGFITPAEARSKKGLLMGKKRRWVC